MVVTDQAAGLHVLTGWDFSAGHLAGAAVTLVVLAIALTAVLRWLTRPSDLERRAEAVRQRRIRDEDAGRRR